MCKKLVDESNIRGNGHAIYQGIITEVENKINQLCVHNFTEMDTVIEDTVTAKAQSGDIDEMASLFNSVSFRDAGQCNQAAASVSKENIDRNIRDLFSKNNIIQLPPDPITAIDLFIPTIALIGAWKEDNEFDRKMIEQISGMEYSEFEAKARTMLSQNSEYLQLMNGNWKVCHKEELLNQCKNKLFDDSIGKLLEAVESILRQKSKCVASKMPYFIPVSGEYDNSLELRGNLVKSLCWFQQQEDIDLELRSDIEFIYLPMLDEYSEVRPRALNTRLSLEPEYFCSLIELFYKERNGEKREIELNKSLSDRLYEILFQFKVIPGIDWNGNFDAKRFDYWMKTVKTWSRDNDRYEVAMHTVGSGLSYAELDEDKLPQTAIIEELNRVENEELRRGYYLGIINQRGVHWIDPEGKPELELAEDYENKANIAESRGYSRYGMK